MNNETLAKMLEECGVNLYDTEVTTEFDKRIFRLYIMSKEGITLDKCQEVSRILSPIFDLEPPLEGEYFFEVSSPGIERKLTKPEHYLYSIGEKVKIKLNNKEKIIGTLEAFSDNIVSLTLEKDEKMQISLNDIDKARTYFEW
ncbi:MAG: ribosome maturation factor RimP [Sulfurospirillaceae bacterium]|jgi:ribosome maturation factor RimP|nr:ribosome maturation factor RimP [Sulfurospirillaceae bacterium]MDD2825559.1 ribosome maturation factor RimP [Sulfurospirillaceae bacterium]